MASSLILTFYALSLSSKSLSPPHCLPGFIWLCDCHILTPSLSLCSHSISPFHYLTTVHCLSHSELLLLSCSNACFAGCCTFTLYISFSLAGWLMLWLLITEAVPAGIRKYKHSCPSLHTFLLYLTGETLQVIQDWNYVSKEQRHQTNPRPERGCLKSCRYHYIDDNLETLCMLCAYKHKESSGWLIAANTVSLEPRKISTDNHV